MAQDVRQSAEALTPGPSPVEDDRRGEAVEDDRRGE